MTLEQLIEQARTEGKYIFCYYQQLWFSPDELEQLNKQGQFRWGAVNFALRDPQERLDGMYVSVEKMKRDIQSLQSKMGGGGRALGTASQFDNVEPR